MLIQLAKLERVDFFSDGILAIAATLPVLDLKVPRIENEISIRALWEEFFALWPSYH